MSMNAHMLLTEVGKNARLVLDAVHRLQHRFELFPEYASGSRLLLLSAVAQWPGHIILAYESAISARITLLKMANLIIEEVKKI